MLVRRTRAYFGLRQAFPFQKALARSCRISSLALINAFSTLNRGPPSLVELSYGPPIISQRVLYVPLCQEEKLVAESGSVIRMWSLHSPPTSLGPVKLHFFLIHPPDQGNRCSICRMRPRIREIDDTPDILPEFNIQIRK